jgi:hypothetical protein
MVTRHASLPASPWCWRLAAFTAVFNPWLLLGISVFVNIALIPFARLVKEADPS